MSTDITAKTFTVLETICKEVFAKFNISIIYNPDENAFVVVSITGWWSFRKILLEVYPTPYYDPQNGHEFRVKIYEKLSLEQKSQIREILQQNLETERISLDIF